MEDRIYKWVANRLPKELVSACSIRLMVAATTGKYGNTVVPELSGMDAICRWSRIHGLGGSGSDEHYDSNRNRN